MLEFPSWLRSFTSSISFASVALAIGGFLLNRYGKKLFDKAELRLVAAAKSLRDRYVRYRLGRVAPIAVALRRSPLSRAETLAEWQRAKTDEMSTWLSYLATLILSYVASPTWLRTFFSIVSLVVLFRSLRHGGREADFQLAYGLEKDARFRDIVDNAVDQGRVSSQKQLDSPAIQDTDMGP